MVTARLAHVIRYITPDIEEQHGTAPADQDRFRRKSKAPVPLAMTGRKSKPPSGEVTAIRGGAVTLAEAADAFLSSPRAASPNTRRAYARRCGADRARATPGTRRWPGRASAPWDSFGALGAVGMVTLSLTR